MAKSLHRGNAGLRPSDCASDIQVCPQNVTFCLVPRCLSVEKLHDMYETPCADLFVTWQIWTKCRLPNN